MSDRTPIALFLLALLSVVPQADAKNKKKQQLLPDLVLRAETALVVIHPDAGEPLTNPSANRTAQDEVEKAMMKWGRFKLVKSPRTANLIIAVRKGHANGPTIRNSPMDDRPVIGQQTDVEIQVGGQRGRPPDLTNPGFGGPESRRPHISNDVGPPEDTFEVYLGGSDYPLDQAPVWRYMAKDALNGPQVEAIEQFRKALADSEEQRRLRQKH